MFETVINWDLVVKLINLPSNLCMWPLDWCCNHRCLFHTHLCRHSSNHFQCTQRDTHHTWKFQANWYNSQPDPWSNAASNPYTRSHLPNMLDSPHCSSSPDRKSIYIPLRRLSECRCHDHTFPLTRKPSIPQYDFGNAPPSSQANKCNWEELAGISIGRYPQEYSSPVTPRSIDAVTILTALIGSTEACTFVHILSTSGSLEELKSNYV